MFLIAPTLLFVKTLIEYQALFPKFHFPVPQILKDDTFFWLTATAEGAPLYRGKPISLSLKEHDSLLKVIYFVMLWVLLVLTQLFSVFAFCALYFPHIAFHVPLWIVWFIFGAYLLQIKMLSVGISSLSLLSISSISSFSLSSLSLSLSSSLSSLLQSQ